jgi:hypothetical protein
LSRPRSSPFSFFFAEKTRFDEEERGEKLCALLFMVLKKSKKVERSGGIKARAFFPSSSLCPVFIIIIHWCFICAFFFSFCLRRDRQKIKPLSFFSLLPRQSQNRKEQKKDGQNIVHDSFFFFLPFCTHTHTHTHFFFCFSQQEKKEKNATAFLSCLCTIIHTHTISPSPPPNLSKKNTQRVIRARHVPSLKLCRPQWRLA